MSRNGWFAGAFMLMAASVASASPWAEVGDAQLRSDIQILATAGVIDDITTHWPIPWAGIVSDLRREDALSGQPAYIREAARRVLKKAGQQMHIDDLRAGATIDATNLPDTVRGFDAMNLAQGEAQLSLEYMTSTSAARISAGIFAPKFGSGKTLFMPDGSYFAQKVGGALIYAGYLSHWWGPGWISALSYSNNARPFPQVGIERDSTEAPRSPWLNWIGPWQMEFLVGWFNDKRIATNTLWDGMRFTSNPLPGLQLGAALTTEFCGKGFPCKPLVVLFGPINGKKTANQANYEFVVDVHYARTVYGVPFEIYSQLMNEDSNFFSPGSATSHLFGASTWLPIGGQNVRLTFEYTDTIATKDLFSFGHFLYGQAYNNYQYVDGMRYDGRDLGASLDTDSRLLSLQASVVDAGDRTFTLTFHRAQVSTPFTATLGPPPGNPLTTAPVTIDIGEARVSVPWTGVKLDLVARIQDDQLRPAHGFTAAIESALSVQF